MSFDDKNEFRIFFTIIQVLESINIYFVSGDT